MVRYTDDTVVDECGVRTGTFHGREQLILRFQKKALSSKSPVFQVLHIDNIL